MRGSSPKNDKNKDLLLLILKSWRQHAPKKRQQQEETRNFEKGWITQAMILTGQSYTISNFNYFFFWVEIFITWFFKISFPTCCLHMHEKWISSERGDTVAQELTFQQTKAVFVGSFQTGWEMKKNEPHHILICAGEFCQKLRKLTLSYFKIHKR